MWLGLFKKESSCLDEVMRQPFSSNTSIILLGVDLLLLVVAQNGRVMALAKCSRILDLWDGNKQRWKELSEIEI